MNYRKYFLLVLVTSMALGICAQKNDYIWLTGFGSQSPDTFSGFRYGNTKMDFNQSPVAVSFDSLKMNFEVTNTSYSDSSGNLLFYSNGIYVANSLDEKIANSDSLNAGWWQYDWDPTLTITGYRTWQGIEALPDVGNANHYYLIHSLIDSISGSNGTDFGCLKILATYLDMSANGGHGQVIYKNQPVLTGYFSIDLTAVKHGNGRDWWILVQNRNTNCFSKILLDSIGLHVVDSTCLGTSMAEGEVGACCFSPDGSKFIYLCSTTGLNIYDFDRCTGTLSKALNLPLPLILDSSFFKMGVAVSPNSRFIYVSISTHIYQIDLWDSDMFHHIDTIANYDGWYFTSPIFGGHFFAAQLAPDGKIYITCGESPYFHVINNPDLKGDSCNFVFRGDSLAGISLGVPNYPNYRLGSLTQSQCDSLTTFTQNIRDAKEQILKVFPNPAVDIATVDYGFTDWNKGAVSLEITDNLGQAVYTHQLPMYSGFQKLDISRFAAGMYTVYIKRSNAVVAMQKFVVTH